MVDRAGKMWSRRIGDTWTSWTTTREEETVESTGLEISVIDQPNLGAFGKAGVDPAMPYYKPLEAAVQQVATSVRNGGRLTATFSR